MEDKNDLIFYHEVNDYKTLQEVAEFVRNPVVFSDDYCNEGSSRNIEQDLDLKKAFDNITKEMVNYLKTLQQVLSTLDNKAEEDLVIQHQQRVLGQLLR